MLLKYKVIDKDGVKTDGQMDSASKDVAISDLQKRGFNIISLEEVTTDTALDRAEASLGSIGTPRRKVKQKDMVIFSRQASTLFESGVSALKTFRLLAAENSSPALQIILTRVADSIEKGVSLSDALNENPETFSSFYVSMVKSGEETGKLKEVFLYLADYLDRDYDLAQKTKKALTYPAFVITTFIAVMIVMFVFIIPKMAAMYADQGQTLPWVTQVVLGISSFFVDYGIFLLFGLIIFGWLFVRYSMTEEGRYNIDEFKLNIPVIKNLYQKMFLTRLADNMNTMLTSGVPIIRSLEITAGVVDNVVYKRMLARISKKVSDGLPLSKAFFDEPEIPVVLVQMIKIGEETGELGKILKSLALFYKREVDDAIDTSISLIEPLMIVGLGLGVGFLVAAVLLPMYSLSADIS